MNLFSPITPPEIDPRNERELVEYGMSKIYEASNGKLNDFSSSSPARALVEGMAFSGAELLYFVNKFSTSVAYQFLAISGVMRKEGSYSKANLTFTLTAALSSPFTIPAGFLCTTSDRNLGFTTDFNLIIPAGAISGTVSATSEDLGTTYNVAAYTLTNISQPLSYLKSVENIEAASGGADQEDEDAFLNRAYASLRRTGLISVADYQDEVEAILGEGSAIKIIGNLAADKITERIGCVHIFALNPDYSLLSSAQLIDLQTSLQNKSHVSCNIYCSNAALFEVSVKVIAQYLEGTDPQAVAEDIYAALDKYLTPGKLPLGATILLKEVEYAVRNSAALKYVQSITLNGLSTNLALPFPYSAAYLDDLTVELVVDSTTTYFFSF